jgi:hypothetical protein
MGTILLWVFRLPLNSEWKAWLFLETMTPNFPTEFRQLTRLKRIRHAHSSMAHLNGLPTSTYLYGLLASPTLPLEIGSYGAIGCHLAPLELPHLVRECRWVQLR